MRKAAFGIGAGAVTLIAIGKQQLLQKESISENPDEAIKQHTFDKHDLRNVSLWNSPTREHMLENMRNLKAGEEYDLLVVGGGASGTGVALDAASRGLKVALVERDDFAAGTSSKSTKLVHGGVRYLEKAFWKLDIDQYRLVQEALAERSTVLKIAPYLTSQLPIMCPIYKWYLLPYYWAGTKAYDLVAGSKGLESSYYLSRSKALKEFPMLKSDNLVGAVVYYDGQQNDSRMNVALALTAAFYGAHIGNHVEVQSLTKNELGKINGAVCKDLLSGDEFHIKAKGVINATGPFCDAIRQMDDPSAVNIISPSSGTHIVLPHYFSPEHMGLIDPATSDGRVIFFLPWESNTVAGTTDSPTKVTYDPKPTEEEIDFILNEVSHYLHPSILVRRGDVLSAWTGIRPLVRNPLAKNTAELVRSHLIYASKSNLITVAGGKWTTYRKMAEETVDMAIEVLGLKPQKSCHTEDLLLVGSHGYDELAYIKLIQHFGMETEVARHLVHNYGDRATMVASMASKTDQRWPLFGKRLSYPYYFIEAEVRYAVRREYARTAVDVLARRTRLAFLNAAAAKEALPRVIQIMSRELNWSKQKQQEEYDATLKYLDTMGLSIISSRSVFKSEEILHLRKEFRSIDKDADGVIGSGDLKTIFDALHVPVAAETLYKIIEEIDANCNGVIDFDEFLDVMTAVDEVRHETHFGSLVDDIKDLAITDEPNRSGGGV